MIYSAFFLSKYYGSPSRFIRHTSLLSINALDAPIQYNTTMRKTGVGC